MQMMTTKTASKVWASAQFGSGGAFVATILLWLLADYGGVEMPSEVQVAVTAIIVSAVTFGSSWLAGYKKAPNARDKIITEAEEQTEQ